MINVQRVKKPPKVQAWEPHFDLGAVAYELPEAEMEYRVCPGRRWRFDRAYPAYHVSVEIEGGLYSRGRHVRADGYEGDCEKYNTAQVSGWIVLRFSPRQVISGECWSMIESALRARGWKGER